MTYIYSILLSHAMHTTILVRFTYDATAAPSEALAPSCSSVRSRVVRMSYAEASYAQWFRYSQRASEQTIFKEITFSSLEIRIVCKKITIANHSICYSKTERRGFQRQSPSCEITSTLYINFLNISYSKSFILTWNLHRMLRKSSRYGTT
jgi:hypothetical protein